MFADLEKAENGSCFLYIHQVPVFKCRYLNILGSVTSYIMQVSRSPSHWAFVKRCSGSYPAVMKTEGCRSLLPFVACSFSKLLQVSSASFSLPAMSSSSVQPQDPRFTVPPSLTMTARDWSAEGRRAVLSFLASEVVPGEPAVVQG